MFTSDWGWFDPHSSWTALFSLTISLCKLFSQLHCFLPVSSVFLLHCGWPTWKNEQSQRNYLGLAPCREKKTHFRGTFLSLGTKGVLTIYFALDIIILTCSPKVKDTLCCLMMVHFQLFKRVCKQQLIWLSLYSPGYLAVFLCACQYPVSWCHFKLCTVPCTNSAIHAHQLRPP